MTPGAAGQPTAPGRPTRHMNAPLPTEHEYFTGKYWDVHILRRLTPASRHLGTRQPPQSRRNTPSSASWAAHRGVTGSGPTTPGRRHGVTEFVGVRLAPPMTWGHSFTAVTARTTTIPRSFDLGIMCGVSEGCFDRYLRSRRRERTPFTRRVRATQDARSVNESTPHGDPGEVSRKSGGVNGATTGVLDARTSPPWAPARLSLGFSARTAQRRASPGTGRVAEIGHGALTTGCDPC